jgi:RNA polymerase sigma-70 factor (ECF subfamily)
VIVDARSGGVRTVIDDGVQLVRVPESFDAFYLRERSGMVGLAFVLSGSRLAAEDLAQDAFIAALRRWDEVGRLDQPAAWVRKVVANNSFSLLRRLKAEAKAVARATVRSEGSAIRELPLPSDDLWKAVRDLPRRQTEAVALYYLGGMTMKEIAETLGCSKETVNTHLRRARATLEKRLDVGEEI